MLAEVNDITSFLPFFSSSSTQHAIQPAALHMEPRRLDSEEEESIPPLINMAKLAELPRKWPSSLVNDINHFVPFFLAFDVVRLSESLRKGASQSQSTWAAAVGINQVVFASVPHYVICVRTSHLIYYAL